MFFFSGKIHLFTDETESFEHLVESLDYALFRYENTGKTKKYYPCQIVPVGPGYLQSSEAFAMVKGSHLDEVFSNQILKLQVLSQLK